MADSSLVDPLSIGGMAETVELDMLQGVLSGRTWFHLDLENDVLYLCNEVFRNERVFGEESPEGFTILRTDSGELAGITAVSFWKQFGAGWLKQASIEAVKESVAAWAK